MDKVNKFFKKINKKNRLLLFKKINLLIDRNIKGLDIRKIKNTIFFRMRVGNIRIVFHYKNEIFHLNFIGWRNNNTYKKLKK